MEASAPCCFRLEATRGPHSGLSHHYCWIQGPEPSPSSPLVRVLAIGRRKRCWLRLPTDLEVSSVHAELQLTGEGDNRVRVSLCDVRSTNGSKLNGKSLVPKKDYLLTDGDLIDVGRTSLRFVKVVHQEQCKGDSKAVASTPEPQMEPSRASNDAEFAVDRLPVVTSGSSCSEEAAVNTNGIIVDHQDTEPVRDEIATKAVNAPGGSNGSYLNAGGGEVVSASAQLTTVAVNGGDKYCAVANSPEEATCTACSMIFGKLGILKQQAHLNACLGGRAVADQTAVVAKEVKPKTRKRGNAGGAVICTKKPRKPKRDEAGDAPAAPTKPAKKPRKRKRVDAREDIELALALAPSSTLSKEEQTDLQLAAATKKLEQLDVQLAQLAKRRINLVKSMERLEKTKEKLRKSLVLPPARVRELLDLKSALCTIFPSSRQQARPMNQSDKEHAKDTSDVATHYASARWRGNGSAIECESVIECNENTQSELAMVATISMWARASQQLFGLQRSTLLYRNSVLRAFLSDNEDVNSDFVNNEDAVQEDGQEPEAESVPIPVGIEGAPDCIPGDSEVPDVVKRVFPEWRRDLAFLQGQAPNELEMALETMNDALKRVDEPTESNGTVEGVACGEMEDASESLQTDSLGTAAYREEQQVACEYMAQKMTRLITEKRTVKTTEEQQQ